MARNIEFRKVALRDFPHRHFEAHEALESEAIEQTLPRTYGEVKIPGHGWHACTLDQYGKPNYFYSEDDGWLECPRAAYTEV